VWKVSPEKIVNTAKAQQLETSRKHLTRHRREGDGFLQRFVTKDETWAYHNEPEGKGHSMVRKHKSSPEGKRVRRQSSAGKIMLTLFWDTEGVVAAHITLKGETVNSESNLMYYEQN
jgi:hypothetical protein